MNIQSLRLGNLIKVYPRPNQEGLLSISEFHKETVIGEMINPRQGYTFRIKFDEINLILITPDWLKSCGFINQPETSIWKDSRGYFDLTLDANGENFLYFDNRQIGNVPIKYVSDLQNQYFNLTGIELDFDK